MTRCYHSSDDFFRTPSSFILKNISTAFLAGFLLLAVSCEEDPTQMGRDLLPSGDSFSIMSTDTFRVKSWTMYSNSVQSSNPSTSYLGQLYDPYFGTTTASFVSQVRIGLGSEWPDGSIVIDSIKLFLNLLSVSGKVDKPHYLKLSEIDKVIYTDSVYYSSRIVPLTGFSVSDILLPELKADTINVIELDIPVELGYEIMRDTSMLFYDDSKPDFRSYFKGLLFELTESDDPIMMSLSLAPPSGFGYSTNYFEISMHNESDEATKFYLVLDAVNRNASFNRYLHDFDAAVPGKMISHRNDTNFLDTLSYVQTMNGVYTKMQIPGLEAIKNNPGMKGIAVNKARLTIPVLYDDDIYTPKTIPSQLYLRYVTSTGSKYIVPDYSISPSFFDGMPDTTKAVYNLNIATFLQGYLEDKTGLLKPELELFMNPASSNNVILKANNNSSPVKFDFTYTSY